MNGIRILRDDKFYVVPRPDMIEQIRFLDAQEHLVRRDRHSLVWVNLKNAYNIKDFKNSYKNRPALIVGKGKSLDSLTRDMIPEDMVIFACNDAIKHINFLDLPNQVFCCQVDRGNVYPGANMIVTVSCIDLYEHPIMASGYEIDLGVRFCCGQLASLCALYLGCSHVVLTAFDGAYGGDCEYAKTVGYSATIGGEPDRFKSHKYLLERALEGVPHGHVFIESTAQNTVIYDILQQLQYSPQEQYEVQDSEPQVENTGTEDFV